MAFDQKLNVPPNDLSVYNIVIGGPKKIGKTSLVKSFHKDHHICECEVGNAIHIQCHFMDVGSLNDLNVYINEAKKSPWVKLWIMDEFNLPYKWCQIDICRNRGIDHPSDDDGHGRVWDMISTKYLDVMSRFLDLPGGHIFTTHAVERTITTVAKQKLTRFKVEYGAGVKRFIDPKIHCMWMMDYTKDGERVLIIQGDDYYEAGSAGLENHFKTPSGKSIKQIPLGRSPDEGYKNIVACFNNQMELEERFLVGVTNNAVNLPTQQQPNSPAVPPKVTFKIGK